jgi:hypothetical protein
VIASDFRTSIAEMIERIAAIAAHRPEERREALPPKGPALLDGAGALIRDVPFSRSGESGTAASGGEGWRKSRR